MNTDFDAYVEGTQNGVEHAKEIISTRVGGLGGSDAALLLRVGENGLSALTASDNRRLLVMMGKQEPEDFGGNMYTNAGHKFEDWMAEYSAKDMQREQYVARDLAKNFKTFAHADFVKDNATIYECKFVTTKTTDKVLETYKAQLQWYYILGATAVFLVHGTGTLDNPDMGTTFQVQRTDTIPVDRDEAIISTLLNGIKILDEAITDGWMPQGAESIELQDTPAAVQYAFCDLATAKEMTKNAKELETFAKSVISEYFTMMGYTKVSDAAGGHVVSAVKEKVSKVFDVKTFVEKVKTMANGNMDYPFKLETVLLLVNESYVERKTSATISFK